MYAVLHQNGQQGLNRCHKSHWIHGLKELFLNVEEGTSIER